MIYLKIRNWAKKLNICAVAGAMLLTFTSANAETIVHTTRYNYDADNYANSVENATALTATAKAKQNGTKKKPTPRRPVPYTWEQAVEYAEMHPEDITPHKIGGYKDKYGNFSKWRCIDFLGDQGLMNRGNSFWGRPSHTYLRLVIHYGQETNAPTPFATIIWAADVNKRYQNDLNQNLNDRKRNNFITDNSSPQYIRIVFESGYEKEFSTDLKNIRGLYYSNFNIKDILLFPLSLLLSTSAGDKRSGYILLTNEDIWDIYKHGKIANVYLDDDKGMGLGTGQLSFFYSGNKQEEDKIQLTYGFEHIVRLLDITPATLEGERILRKRQEDKEYREKLREEVRKEIMKEEMRKEILEEVREEYKLGKEGK